jgi:AraC-like DNA-binding protein
MKPSSQKFATNAFETEDEFPPGVVFRAGLGRRLPQSYMRVGTVMSLPQVLQDFGVVVENVLNAEKLPRDLFRHPDNAIPFPAYCSLLTRCGREIGRDDLGLLMCEKTSASSLGLVGFLLQQERDVRSAINVLVRYLHHTNGAAVVDLTEIGDQACLGYFIYGPAGNASDQIYDGAMAVGVNIMQKLCGPDWSPTEIRLSRRRPADPKRYERVYGAAVQFDDAHSGIVFPAAWLDTKIPQADDALRRMLQEQVDLIELEEPTLSERVRRILRALLVTRAASVHEVSALLRTTRRTLARRLAAEGTTFKKLSEAVHFEIASQLMQRTALTLTRIAFVLNYSETSAFTRAFRKWSGMTPTEWRVRHAVA